MTRKLLNDNIVEITTVTEVPRYSGRAFREDQAFYDVQMTGFKDSVKMWVGARDYSNLTTEDSFEPNMSNLEEDRQAFQRYLDREYGKGKYEAYVLGAYIHGATSFSVSKEGDHRCRFDSGQLGFIGLPADTKNEPFYSNPDKVADELTALWEGEYITYEVVDELTLDVVESITTHEHKDYCEFAKNAKEKYKVDFDNIEVQY